MSASETPVDFTDTVAWTGETEISASDVVEKQQLVKDILGMQEGLKGLMTRISTVQQDCVKAEADNEMLQMYIDSVTKSLAAKS
ncbi:uncharacterized protein FA14DRAFT_168296 [Meira miltonrushii]|uniref:Uncharacterized protein n=1 Tax=Meira miltonrushii TaxID=1280837 RepID=A0A316VBW9_9BASI|nr:uncharacterized protein FA14DRAFT_168296 [Meira miltonrushii]PWN33753.1 hypothetical protein FA14DRAFT_168296 [Meira miltonrushii]